MRWVVLIAIAVLVGVIVWSRAGSVSPAMPIEPDVLVAATPDAAAGDPERVARASSVAGGPTVEDGGEEIDAGEPVELAVELLEANGERRAVGAGVVFSRADGGYVTSGRTNVMGFTAVSLLPGVYAVGPSFDQASVRIGAETTRLTLRIAAQPEPHDVSGLVVDETGRPVADADVTLDEQLHEPRFSYFHGLRTDSTGRFRFRTLSQEVRVRAVADRKRSLWIRAVVPGPEVKLQLVVGVAEVTYRFRGVDTDTAFAQVEQGADLREEQITSGRAIEVIPGRLVTRFRALEHGHIFTGYLELDLSPNTKTRAVVEFTRGTGLRARVVNEWKDTVAGVPLVARAACEHLPRCCMEMSSTSGLDGTVDLTPDRLCSYAPLFVFDLGGVWRNLRPVQARVGDEPAEIVARPFDAALDSTDASTPVPWGGDR
jgi:hypothetical protein